MGNYNFENDDREFNETVRLDYINEEVRKTSEDDKENTIEIEPITKHRLPHLKKGSDMPFSNLIKYSVLGGIIIFLFIFAVVLTNSVTDKNPNQTEIENDNDISQAVTETDSIYAIVLNSEKNNEISVYNIKEKKRMSFKVTADTVVLASSGGEVNFSEMRWGDIVLIEKIEDGKVMEIRVPHDVWRKDFVKGAEVELENNAIVYEGISYAYGSDTFFVSDGASIFPGDISKEDTITFMGKESMVFSVRVELGHGVIVFKNHENIEEMEVLLDDIPIDFNNETSTADAAVGSYRLTVKGKNIKDFITAVSIEEKARVNIDLAEAEKKLSEGIIKLNVDEKGYTVLIDGVNYTDSLTEIIVPKGIHKIEIIKTGFEKWSTTLNVGDSIENITVKLKSTAEKNAEESIGDLTIYSVPGWSKIYVDGEYKGVAPVMTKLSYGEHYIEAQLEGYETFKTHVTVDSPEKTITAKFN